MFQATLPRRFILGLAIVGAAMASGCGGGSSSDSDFSGGTSNPSNPNPPTNPPTNPPPAAGRNIMIESGQSPEEATIDALNAFIDARPGDVIEFDCGFFDLESTLLLTSTEDITIQGCGIDETVLSFRNSDGVEGILMDSVRGVRVRDLTVADTDGNGFELRQVDHGTLQRVRAFWSSGGGRESPDPITAENFQDGRLNVPCTDPATQNPNVPETQGGDTTSPDYTVSESSGRYGIYPVNSDNILVEQSEAIGASDAGIYVGQTSTAIIRDSRAAYNVFGLEIENVRHGAYLNNVAECNTGGFLIYDLDNLTRYGERTIMRGNISRMNNTYNFTEGGFVANVPPGSGMITLAYDRIDVIDNQFIDNNTGGIIHASYELFPEGAGRPTDNKIDFYTEGMRIAGNVFENNGNSISLPTTEDLANQDVARFLPALVGLKTLAGCAIPTNLPTCLAALNTEHPIANTGFRGAHIIWDGLLDEYDADCPYPVDSNGEPVPEEENFEGKPRHTNEHPNPDCHYNAYKFNTDEPGNPRKVPLFFASCIAENNSFSSDSLTFANFRGTKGLEAALIALDGDPTAVLNPANVQSILAGVPQFPASFDRSAHDCQAAYGATLNDILPIEPVVIPPFVPSGNIDPAPAPEVVDQLCNADVAANEVNFAAAPVNCPRLDQYNLFADPEDPTSTPNGNGAPFVLNSKLFSDYAVKYRVLYLPPGEQAVYMEPGASSPASTLFFPTGTIIAKTFSFLDDGSGVETDVETRLIIKRETSNGSARWVGIPYIWETTASGERIARLQLAGDTVPASWNYADADSGRRNQGSTGDYLIPNANQCLSCHANNDLEGGSAPIGLKVRNLNRPYESESSMVTGQSQHPIAGQNQIAYLCSTGMVANCPSNLGVDQNSQIANNLNRIPHYNVPGDSGFAAGSDEDVESRTRAWLEVNCHHCHNPRGFAQNTGYYLDVFRQVDTSYGICKGPTATGAEGSGGRSVDVHPGRADLSILEFRISPAADTPAARMPPLARSVVDEEAHDLIIQWINDVVVADDDRYPGSEACAGN